MRISPFREVAPGDGRCESHAWTIRSEPIDRSRDAELESYHCAICGRRLERTVEYRPRSRRRGETPPAALQWPTFEEVIGHPEQEPTVRI